MHIIYYTCSTSISDVPIKTYLSLAMCLIYLTGDCFHYYHFFGGFVIILNAYKVKVRSGEPI